MTSKGSEKNTHSGLTLTKNVESLRQGQTKMTTSKWGKTALAVHRSVNAFLINLIYPTCRTDTGY
jgi:hypothetical protein